MHRAMFLQFKWQFLSPWLFTNKTTPPGSLVSRLCESVSCLPLPHQTLEGKNKKGGGLKLMTHNCHDRGRGARRLFYIPGMYICKYRQRLNTVLRLWIWRVTKLAFGSHGNWEVLFPLGVLQIMKKNGLRALSQIIIPRRKGQAAVFSFLLPLLTLRLYIFF